MRIIVLITCHNRRSKTLACLRALEKCESDSNWIVEVILVDDGSSDGTADAALQAFPRIRILKGDGSLYWNGGMCLAQQEAMKAKPDFVLWLNDDTVLVPDALRNLVSTYFRLLDDMGEVIVVGATVDPTGRRLSYGGAIAKGPVRRFTYKKVGGSTSPVECDVMNGNIVLLSKSALSACGNLDPRFEHAMGDTDYALRAREAGLRVFVAPGIAGFCAPNPSTGSFRDESLGAGQRWKLFLSRKGLPWRSWFYFVRRHGGLAWPLYFLYPYVFFATRLAVRAVTTMLPPTRIKNS